MHPVKEYLAILGHKFGGELNPPSPRPHLGAYGHMVRFCL